MGVSGLTMLLGGARSGKSRLAERLAREGRQPVAYVATALAWDSEMEERIARHRSDRPAEWMTLEMPGGTVEDPAAASPIAAAVREAAASCPTIVLDCLTIYLSRRLQAFYAEELLPRARQDEAQALVMADLEALVATRAETGCELLVVSNEVGSGIVPAYAAGRLLRDVAGQANQWLTERASLAYLVVAGVPLDLKRLGGL
jgi:adenosylcobinamide kinase / adenosylcobinamide-phosphate guanylyltransferase